MPENITVIEMNSNGLVNFIVAAVAIGAAVYLISIAFSPAKKAAKGVSKASKGAKKAVPPGTVPLTARAV